MFAHAIQSGGSTEIVSVVAMCFFCSSSFFLIDALAVLEKVRRYEEKNRQEIEDQAHKEGAVQN
jgi:hypothetical protein